MAAWTNESFLEMIQEDYADVDWNNLPDLENSPSYWCIRGMEHQHYYFVDQDKHLRSQCGLETGRFPSKEAAQIFMDGMKDDPRWNQEELHEKEYLIEGTTTWTARQYYGPVLFETLHIVELKDDNLSNLHFYKSCLDRIKTGEKVFPMYLP